MITSQQQTLESILGSEITSTEPMHGGFWAATSLLTTADGRQLVLRVMPDDGPAAKEIVVHRGVATQGYPVPAVVAAGDRSAGLGGPFMVMERVVGRMPLADLDLAKALRGLRSILRDLPDLLGTVMAQLHQLDAAPVRAALLSEPTGVPFDIDGRLRSLTVAATASGRGDLIAAAQWLERSRPATEHEVICHGDLHPFNVMVDGDRWVLLDWTAATLADPAHDLAATSLLIGNPPLVAPRAVAPLLRGVGRVLVRRFLKAYESAGGTLPARDVMEWHTVLCALRVLVEVNSWTDRTEHRGHPLLIIERAATKIVAAVARTS